MAHVDAVLSFSIFGLFKLSVRLIVVCCVAYSCSLPLHLRLCSISFVQCVTSRLRYPEHMLCTSRCRCEYCTSVATCSAPVGCRRSPPLPFSFSFKLSRFRFTDSNIIIFKVFLYKSRQLKPQKPEFMLLKLFTVYNNNKHCWLVRQTLLRTFNKTFMQVNVNWNDWN